MDEDIVLAKANIAQRCMDRIAHARRQLDSGFDRDDIVVLNLQRAIQATMDVAYHIVASENLGLPDTAAAAFDLLAHNRKIDAALCERLHKMVGFRNIAVHDYQTLDPKIVDAIVEKHLDDLRNFFKIVTTDPK